MTRVHIRTAGGPADGRGHLSRTLAMSEALAAVGADVSVEVLRGLPTEVQSERLASLGVSVDPALDADVMLVDLPDPDEGIGPVGRRRTPRVAAFDDREWLRGRVDLVVQPSMPTWHGAGDAARVLAGYEYFPILPRVRDLATKPPPVASSGQRPEVLVCFGGSDPADVTARLAPLLADGDSWSTSLVVGPDYRGAGEALRAVRDPSDLHERLQRATVVVAGAGSMKFELALLGRPAILVAAVDDQLAVGPPFAATGAARYLGDGRLIEPDAVRAAVAELLGDEPARSEMGRRGREIVDGRGAERVAAALIELAG